jgi:uncharacterized protein (TIGR00297 family)
MIPEYVVLILLLAVGMFFSVTTGKLTVGGAAAGGACSSFIYLASGFIGIALIAAFFIIGTLVTGWKMGKKVQMGVAEKNKGRRTAGQVLANAGAAGIIGALIFILPDQKLLLSLMIAASFSAATADTVSSELGTVYGHSFYNILTFKKDVRGLDGVISKEGTLLGIAGSVLIALIYAAGFGWSIHFLWIVIAGTIGNLSDSFLGATVERKGYIGNNWVNFLNTLIAALAALLLYVTF